MSINPVGYMRSLLKLSQTDFAILAKTSQPTIHAYERDSKSPTWSTLLRIAECSGLIMNLRFCPKLNREDFRSLLYHERIISHLENNPTEVIRKAKLNLKKTKKHHPGACHLWRGWTFWLSLPLEELVARIRDPGEFARDMRQVSPFAGILSPQERSLVLKQLKSEFK